MTPPTNSEQIWLNKVKNERNTNESFVQEKINLIKDQILSSFFLVQAIRLVRDKFLLFIILNIGFFISNREHRLISIIIFIILLLIKYTKLNEKVEFHCLLLAEKKKPELYKQLLTAQKELGNIKVKYYQELDEKCVNWSTYPPDWEIRKQKVLKRDGHKCEECGWPEGFQRYRRQLHIHHKVPISKGGTHDMDNLVTLCNICHSKVDASHRRVRKIAKKKKSRYFR